MSAFPIPVVAFGPGSQLEMEPLNCLNLPQGMRTYSAPVINAPDAAETHAPTRQALNDVLCILERHRPDSAPESAAVDLMELDAANRRLVDQVLGEGEVSARIATDAGDDHIQESVFAGVWRVRRHEEEGRLAADYIEVGEVPEIVRLVSTMHCGAAERPAPSVGPGVMGAPALLAEIQDCLRQGAAEETHVINLSLLPVSPEDAAWLDAALGRGRVTILSRGYGNCRITATALPRVWWVQYFNSQDALILNTIEVTEVPAAACAAEEDIAESRERLAEVLEWVG